MTHTPENPRLRGSHLRLVAAAPGGLGVEVPLRKYEEYLIGLGLADATVRNYRRTVARAMHWAQTEGVDLAAIEPSEATRLAARWPNSNSSRRQLRCALVHLWDMWGVSGPDRAIRVPPRPRSRWRGIERKDVQKLLARARADWPRGAVIYLGFYLGLRREEIASLRWRDFDPDLTWVTILGKQDRTRYLPVHQRVRDMLAPQRWPGTYVFPGRLGGHITPATVSKWVAEMATEAGIGHLSPHQMRHTFGARINDGSRDIYLAKDMLGHVDVKTTEVYTRMELDRLAGGTRHLDWEDKEDDIDEAA